MQDFLHPPPGDAPVAIYEDGGGLVDKYQAMAARYRLERRQVEIRGSCRSACVLALSVPTVCVAPAAIVKAHQAYELNTKIERPDVTQQMMQSLPEKIRNTLQNNVRTHYTETSSLTYKELINLGIPSCGSRPASPPRRASHVKTNLVDRLFGYFAP